RNVEVHGDAVAGRMRIAGAELHAHVIRSDDRTGHMESECVESPLAVNGQVGRVGKGELARLAATGWRDFRRNTGTGQRRRTSEPAVAHAAWRSGTGEEVDVDCIREVAVQRIANPEIERVVVAGNPGLTGESLGQGRGAADDGR